MKVFGPISPDTVFYRALNGEFDVVVALYHDQGHIPTKLISFEESVNVTLGTPLVRTSVDHGTAHEIAGKVKLPVKIYLLLLTMQKNDSISIIISFIIRLFKQNTQHEI